MVDAFDVAWLDELEPGRRADALRAIADAARRADRDGDIAPLREALHTWAAAAPVAASLPIDDLGESDYEFVEFDDPFERWGEPDEYGIPSNYFGVKQEEFYGIVGRVVMLASLVELRLLYLLHALDPETGRDVHAGKPGAALIKLCRQHLSGLPTQLARDGVDLVSQVATTLEERNTVVHSLWPSPGMDKLYRWRPAPKGKRTSPTSYTVGDETSEAELRSLIEQLARLVEDLGRLRERAHPLR